MSAWLMSRRACSDNNMAFTSSPEQGQHECQEQGMTSLETACDLYGSRCVALPRSTSYLNSCPTSMRLKSGVAGPASPTLQGESGDGARWPSYLGLQGHSMCPASTPCLCSSTSPNKWSYVSLSACEYKHRYRRERECAMSHTPIVTRTQAHLRIHRNTHSPQASQPNASPCPLLAEGLWQNHLQGKDRDRGGAGKVSPCGAGQ